MTREDIMRMAREVGLYSSDPNALGVGNLSEKRIVRFAALVAEAEREAEREACAKICDGEATLYYSAQRCATKIRARGSNGTPA